eukprot:7847774-Pyramimonas_sp.AAC.1
MLAVPCASYTCDLLMACDAYVYDACAVVSGRVPHMGALYVVHTCWVNGARLHLGACMMHVQCMCRAWVTGRRTRRRKGEEGGEEDAGATRVGRTP